MRFTIYDLYSFSIAIAAIIAIVRYKRIYPGFRPFLFMSWAALATEAICYFLIYQRNYTFVPYGIYSVVEGLLITWLFRELGLFGRRSYLFVLLIVFYLLAWLTEVIFFEGMNRNMTWFRLLHSFITVLLSILLLGRELSVQRTFLLKSPVFLICTGFLLYNTIVVIAGVFDLYGYGGNITFRRQVQGIMIYMNLIVNLIYAVAVLCMPHRLRYSLPY
ncbi:MAG TPA: hypothetical protein VHN59_06445 [Chitinophagaceae bacterium]|nr:hypothetical protein [Chitinophagaceae bacterium]